MFFSRKQKSNNASIEKIEELQKKISELQQSLMDMKEQKVEYHFHIEKVDIHEPNLEKLSFHLDQIDIEDLSGALNVGNNFGVSIGEKQKQKYQNQEEEKQRIKDTKKGYSISFANKEKTQ